MEKTTVWRNVINPEKYKKFLLIELSRFFYFNWRVSA